MEFIKIEKGVAQKLLDYLAEKPYKETHDIIRHLIGLPLLNDEPTPMPGLTAVECKEEGNCEAAKA